MKKIIFILLLLGLMMVPLTAKKLPDAPTSESRTIQSRHTGFRKAIWGEAAIVCRQLEGQPDIDNETDVYAFKTTIDGINCVAMYRFTDGKLSSGAYVFASMDDGDWNRQYTAIRRYVTNETGLLPEEKKDYSDLVMPADKYSGNETHLLKKGLLTFTCLWYTKDTRIILYVFAENGKVHMRLRYYPKYGIPKRFDQTRSLTAS